MLGISNLIDSPYDHPLAAASSTDAQDVQVGA